MTLQLSDAETIALATDLIENGNFQETERLVSGLADLGKQALTAYLHGLVELKKGKPEQAKACFRKAIKLNPTQPEPHLHLAALSLSLGETNKALGIAKNAAHVLPSDPNILNNLANILIHTGSASDAIPALEKSLSLNPGQAEVLYALGNSLEQVAQIDRAASVYREILQLSPGHVLANFRVANILKLAKRYEESKSHYRASINVDPGFWPAYYGLGDTLYAEGDFSSSLEVFNLAIERGCRESDIWQLKGIVLKRSGKFSEAIDCFQRALTNDMNHALLNHLGDCNISIGKLEAARSFYASAFEINPQDSTLANNLAVINLKLGNTQAALEIYERALLATPKNGQVLANMATLLLELNKPKEARTVYKRLLDLSPNDPAAWLGIGTTYQDEGNTERALSCFRTSISHAPNRSEAYLKASILLVRTDRPLEALKLLNRAVATPPFPAEAMYVRAYILKSIGMIEQAKADLLRCLGTVPNHVKAGMLLGDIFKEEGNYPAALRYYESAYASDSSAPLLAGKIVRLKLEFCSWTGLQKLVDDIQDKLEKEIMSCAPFEVQATLDSPRLQLKSASLFVDLTCPFKRTGIKPLKRKAKNKRIRIAYLSSDFKEHPVAHHISSLIESHSREKFEIYAISLENHDTDYQRRIKASADKYLSIDGLPDAEAVKLVRSHRIDIAVDLNGYTGANRTQLFKSRIAPVQIAYLGFLGTMGCDFMDYIVADPALITPASREFFKEKVIYLRSYQCNGSAPQAPKEKERKVERSAYGLPADAVVFASFNNNFKINPRVFDLWAAILNRVPNGVLWIYARNELARKNLADEAEARKIERTRIVFAQNVPFEEHLSRHRIADVFLDTFPYNAGSTASNALRMGLPVVTLAGRSLASRYGSSLLQAMDLPELICDSEARYADLAVRLGTDVAYREKIRAKLRKNFGKSLLFNPGKFAADIEQAYSAVLERHRTGLAPVDIHTA